MRIIGGHVPLSDISFGASGEPVFFFRVLKSNRLKNLCPELNFEATKTFGSAAKTSRIKGGFAR